MAEKIKCALCGKEIGGWANKSFDFPFVEKNDKKLCMNCGNKVVITATKINNCKDKYKLEELFKTTIEEVKNSSWEDNAKDILISYYTELVNNNKSRFQKAYIKQEQARREQQNFDKILKEESARKEQQKIEIEEIYKERIANNKIRDILDMNDFYEYDVVTIYDKSDGSTNTEAITKSLKIHSLEGWHLKNIFTNELGKNSVSVAGMGSNSTIDEVILIYERLVSKAVK